MTPRERWLALFEGRTPDRIPTDYWSTGEFHAKLVAAADCDGELLLRKVGIDKPFGINPRLLVEHHPDDPLADIWGIRRRNICYGTGEYDEVDHHPLAAAESVGDIERFRWPMTEHFDYSVIAYTLARNDGYRMVLAGSYEPFLLYAAMRGMEQAYEDLLINPAIAEAGLARIFDFYYEHNRRIWHAGGGKIDLMYLAEDLGGQYGPLFSLDLYRRFLREGQQKMADLARSFGIHVFYHTDGAARSFIPDLIDYVGIEILNPLQWNCPGMQLEGLVRDFGRQVIFHGGIDNQKTLPFGSVQDVRSEVRYVAKVMEKARWICAPCHNIQAISPPQNVLAMYDEVSRLQPAEVPS
jgi:uroporphyrinogen decarboxylase